MKHHNSDAFFSLLLIFMKHDSDHDAGVGKSTHGVVVIRCSRETIVSSWRIGLSQIQDEPTWKKICRELNIKYPPNFLTNDSRKMSLLHTIATRLTTCQNPKVQILGPNGAQPRDVKQKNIVVVEAYEEE